MIVQYCLGFILLVAVTLTVMPQPMEVTIVMDTLEVVDTYQQGVPKTWNPQQ